MKKVKFSSSVKRKKRNSVLFKIAAIVFVLAIGIEIITLQSQILNKKNEEATVLQQLNQQKEINQELQTQLEQGANDEYMQKVAREELGYISPFERVFIDIARE